MEPPEIPYLDACRAVPEAWWRYETVRDGVVMDRVVQAWAGAEGVVIQGTTPGAFEALPAGVVVIRLRARWAHLALPPGVGVPAEGHVVPEQWHPAPAGHIRAVRPMAGVRTGMQRPPARAKAAPAAPAAPQRQAALDL